MNDLSQNIDLAAVNAQLENAHATDVIAWARDTFKNGLVLSSSFGVQSAVMLHLVTEVVPDIPVIFIDTGFHFAETYKFTDELTQRLNLNLKVYQPTQSPAWFVAQHGNLWETDLDTYDTMRKVEPMNRALNALTATATLAGLRHQQTNHRKNLRKVELQDSRYKISPILTWTTKDIHKYLKANDLPYHPLNEKGYASVGDWHSTFPITAGQNERDGRFRGLKQECGLHLPTSQEEDSSRMSADL